jgi:polyphosphate glucokinase
MAHVGVDIGGSGVKGASVDLATGELAGERVRIETPAPSTPDAVAAVLAEVVAMVGGQGRLGCTFPGVVQAGVVRTAPNLDAAWIGTDAAGLFGEATHLPVAVLNDADAAGLAEARFGAAKGVHGVVLVLTFGTGIGSALLVDGQLVPNTELGHVELDGHDAEDRAAASAREDEGLDWDEWGDRVDRYLQHLEALFTPDRFVIGGGVSKRFDKFADHIHVRAEVVPAVLRNLAGIVGAALVGAGREDPT